ncbi:MAG: hypothetical protein GY806_00450 [Gammaproteobacteria bacterium]|nr:hypothetical protein [Gammaproteobacteria bacterium]
MSDFSQAGSQTLILRKQLEQMRAGGVSPRDASKSFRRDEARYAVGWYNSITADIWS